MKKLIALALMASLLGACGGGGGGGGGQDAGTAEGLWFGTTSNSRFVTGLVLDDGAYWILYSSINNPNTIAGVVQGNGVSSNGDFVSSNARDYNFEGLGILSATIDASYAQKISFDGTITYSINDKIIFNSEYDSSYDEAPSLALIAGVYSGTATVSAGTEPSVITISDNGDVNGLGSSGCVGIGSVNPRTNGNVYDVSITFQGFPCANGTSTVDGVVYYDSIDNTLYSAALNSGRTDGYLFLGQKN